MINRGKQFGAEASFPLTSSADHILRPREPLVNHLDHEFRRIFEVRGKDGKTIAFNELEAGLQGHHRAKVSAVLDDLDRVSFDRAVFRDLE